MTGEDGLRARMLSAALARAWIAMDAVVDLPKVVMAQIDGMRHRELAAGASRRYFEEVCYERLLLSGMAWSTAARQAIPTSLRSPLLDDLMAHESDDGSASDAPILDPAYLRWANLKYADRGTADASLWERFRAEAADAAKADCSRHAQVPAERPHRASSNPLTVTIVKQSLRQAFSLHLPGSTPIKSDDGFGFRTGLGGDNCYMDCKLQDVKLLARRLLPFAFEIVWPGGRHRLSISGDRSVWPGAADYRGSSAGDDLHSGLATILALFVKSVKVAVEDTSSSIAH